MEVHAAIDEADVGKIHEGQEATFTVDAYPGEAFRATIFQIRSQPNVQQNVVTYDAVVRFDNPDSKLRPGMTATVRVVSMRREDVLRVPNAALRFKPAPELVLANPGGSASSGGGGGRDGGGADAGQRSPSDRDRTLTTAGAPGPGAAARPAGAAPGASGRGAGQAGGGRGGGGAGRVRGRLYRPAGDKLEAVNFKAGISDDEFTEIAGGDLKAGDEVVVDVMGGAARAGGGSPSSAGGPAGGGPRRTPRMF